MRTLSLGIILIFFMSCSDEKDRSDIALKSSSLNNELKENLRQAKEIFNNLYLPVQMSEMFNNINEDFNPLIIQDNAKIENIVFSNEIALAMGVYGVDLGYVRIFEQYNMASDYLYSIKLLSEKMGISDDVFADLKGYFDQPVLNKDTLEQLSTNIYLVTDYHLRQNGRDRASAYIILGGWLEAIRLGIKIYSNNDNEIILKRICEQQKSLNSIIGLLSSLQENELIINYLEQLYEMQNYIVGLNAAYKKLSRLKQDEYTKLAINSYMDKMSVLVNRMINFAV